MRTASLERRGAICLKVVVRNMVISDEASNTNLFSVAPLMLSSLVICAEPVVIQSITSESSKHRRFEARDAISQKV